MSVIPEVWTATVEQLFYQFYKANRRIRPCQANRHLIEQYLDENLLQLNSENLQRAMSALEAQLAPNPDFVEPVLPVAPEPAPAEEPREESPAERNSRLRSLSVEELRQIVREENPIKYPVKEKTLPASLTREVLLEMPRAKQIEVIKKYSSTAFDRRIQGRG